MGHERRFGRRGEHVGVSPDSRLRGRSRVEKDQIWTMPSCRFPALHSEHTAGCYACVSGTTKKKPTSCASGPVAAEAPIALLGRSCNDGRNRSLAMHPFSCGAKRGAAPCRPSSPQRLSRWSVPKVGLPEKPNIWCGVSLFCDRNGAGTARQQE
jgi:hypothetical protein